MFINRSWKYSTSGNYKKVQTGTEAEEYYNWNGKLRREFSIEQIEKDQSELTRQWKFIQSEEQKKKKMSKNTLKRTYVTLISEQIYVL